MTTTFIVIHALSASGVILLAPLQILRRTKDRRHRFIGRSWVVLMYAVCVSGMFIYTLTGSFTVFHALAIFTFCTTTLGVINIRRGRIRSHVFNMVGSWLGAITAGAFAAFVPGRVIPEVAVEDPMLLWTIIAVVVELTTLWAVYVLRFVRTDEQRFAGSPAVAEAEPEPEAV